MKNLKIFLLVFLMCTPVSASDDWDFPEGLQAFEELMKLESEGHYSHAEEGVRVLADICSEMGPEDFNLMVIFLLQTYYQDEHARSVVYDLLDNISMNLTRELNEQEQDNMLWNTTGGALNGAFLLTFLKMGNRLRRVGIFKSGVEKVIRFLKGKRAGHSKELALKNYRKWFRGYLRRLRNQYLAALGTGGVLGTGVFFYNKSNRRIHPRKSLFAVNALLLAEAVAFVPYVNESLSRGIGDVEQRELRNHIETLVFLLEKESHFASGVSVEKIGESLTVLEKSGTLKISGEELLFVQEQEGMIYVESVLYQLQSLLDFVTLSNNKKLF